MIEVPAGHGRLFIALWPVEGLRRELQSWCRPCLDMAGAQPVARSHLHLTLHFLGDVPRTMLPALRRALALRFQPFELSFSRCERWPGGLLVAVPDAVPQALTDLHATLGDALRRLQLRTETRAYRPHVTLARRHAGALPPQLTTALRWRAGRLALVESGRGAGSGYAVLEMRQAARSRTTADARRAPAAGPAAARRPQIEPKA